MSLLNNLFFDKDNNPIGVRAPTPLIVQGETGTLTQAQFENIKQVYNEFCTSTRLSPAQFATKEVKLADGTVIRMESINGKDRVMVWPVTGGGLEEVKLLAWPRFTGDFFNGNPVDSPVYSYAVRGAAALRRVKASIFTDGWTDIFNKQPGNTTWENGSTTLSWWQTYSNRFGDRPAGETDGGTYSIPSAAKKNIWRDGELFCTIPNIGWSPYVAGAALFEDSGVQKARIVVCTYLSFSRFVLYEFAVADKDDANAWTETLLPYIGSIASPIAPMNSDGSKFCYIGGDTSYWDGAVEVDFVSGEATTVFENVRISDGSYPGYTRVAVPYVESGCSGEETWSGTMETTLRRAVAADYVDDKLTVYIHETRQAGTGAISESVSFSRTRTLQEFSPYAYAQYISAYDNTLDATRTEALTQQHAIIKLCEGTETLVFESPIMTLYNLTEGRHHECVLASPGYVPNTPTTPIASYTYSYNEQVTYTDVGNSALFIVGCDPRHEFISIVINSWSKSYGLINGKLAMQTQLFERFGDSLFFPDPVYHETDPSTGWAPPAVVNNHPGLLLGFIPIKTGYGYMTSNSYSGPTSDYAPEIFHQIADYGDGVKLYGWIDTFSGVSPGSQRFGSSVISGTVFAPCIAAFRSEKKNRYALSNGTLGPQLGTRSGLTPNVSPFGLITYSPFRSPAWFPGYDTSGAYYAAKLSDDYGQTFCHHHAGIKNKKYIVNDYKAVQKEFIEGLPEPKRAWLYFAIYMQRSPFV